MATTPDALTPGKVLFLATVLVGSLLVRLSEQFPSANIADVQAGLFATPDEASWILTVYTMASFAGIVTSVLFIKALSIGRYVVVSSIVFAITAAAAGTAPDLGVMIALRAIQGFAAGGFGPAAFVAAFMVASGPRLPFAVTLLAFVLLLPGTVGPVVSGFVEDSFGWQSLFLIQAGIGAMLALAARAWAPRQAPEWSALKTDWTAVTLLSLALATLTLVLSQGTRRFWFENDMIVWCTAASIGAWAGFVFLARFSPVPIMAPRLLLTRHFGIPIGLNLVFRAGLVVTSYLVPQFLAVVQGYRPRDIAGLMLWGAIPQLLALPVVWWLMQRLDGRAVMALGLVLCAIGTAIVVDGTALFAAEQFRLTLIVFGVGQALFLAPAVVVGATSLKPADLPTASLAFNMTTVGGTTLGVGVVSELVTEREKFHSNVITENVSLYDPLDADRVTALAGAFANRLTDDASATAQAVGHLAALARREAWVLSFNDAFLVVALVLAISAIGIAAIGRSAPLRSETRHIRRRAMKLFTAGLGSLALAGTVFAVAATSMVPGRWITALHSTSTDNAYVHGDVTPISPKINGYIAEVAIRDNQAVRAGDVLFRIDDRDYRARVDQATAAVATRRAVLGNLTSQLERQRAVIEQAVAALRGAEADANRAALDVARVRKLTPSGAVSQDEGDQAEANHLQARAKVAEAEANLGAARRQADVLETQRPQFQADIDAAVAALRLAEIELENTVVRAPSDGRVGERQARVGQYVRPGTLLVAIVPQDFWVVANFKETQIPAMRIGDGITISIDGIPGIEFRGQVESLSPASGAAFALLPPDNATGNFTRIVQRIPVKITFDPGQPGLDRLRPGMSAVVALSGSP
jgi:DHA2 family multidrug resistance protein